MKNFLVVAPLLCVGLFLGMLLFIEIGRRIGLRRHCADPDGARAGSGAVDGAVFALLGLLIAFTFSGAASRFDERRHLVVEEANDIGTAWLRIDLLPAPTQPALRDLFRRYLDSRLAMYGNLPDVDAANLELARSVKLQQEIWTHAVDAARDASPPASMLLLPALNAMIDITTTRHMVTQMHPPAIIFVMLAALALAGATLVGYAMSGGKKRGWLHMVSFAAVMALTVYVILDIEYPRLGLIRVDAIDQVLVDLRHSME